MKNSYLTLKKHVLKKIEEATVNQYPFDFLEIDDFFPSDIYGEFVRNLPKTEKYRPLLHKQTLINNKPTRFELPLCFLEDSYLIELFNGCAVAVEVIKLFSDDDFKQIFLDKFKLSANVMLYPHLYRDFGGFDLPPHTDLPEKAITMGWYLPVNNLQQHSGFDLFIRKDKSFSKCKTIPYLPNKALAFLRSNNSWHGASHKAGNNSVRDSLFIAFYHKKFFNDGVIHVNDSYIERKEIMLY